jgi:hypothetical protein
MIRMATFSNINILDKVSSKVRLNENITTGMVVMTIRHCLKGREEIISYFSAMPVIWFFREFVFLIGAIMMILDNEWRSSNWLLVMFAYIIPLILSQLTLFFLICFVDNCHNSVKKKIDSLIDTMIQNDYDKWSAVISELNILKDYQMTACNLFNINKSVGLSFLSSLISFTVLFQQLLHNM